MIWRGLSDWRWVFFKLRTCPRFWRFSQGEMTYVGVPSVTLSDRMRVSVSNNGHEITFKCYSSFGMERSVWMLSTYVRFHFVRCDMLKSQLQFYLRLLVFTEALRKIVNLWLAQKLMLWSDLFQFVEHSIRWKYLKVALPFDAVLLSSLSEDYTWFVQTLNVKKLLKKLGSVFANPWECHD